MVSDGKCSESRTVRRIFINNGLKSTKKYTNGINVTIRRTLGSDVNASCGQLRKRHMDSKKSSKIKGSS